MNDLLEYIIRPLLTKPDDLRISQTQDQYGTLYTVGVSPEDTGIVIGKEGKVIRAIRAAARVRATCDQTRVSIQLG